MNIKNKCNFIIFTAFISIFFIAYFCLPVFSFGPYGDTIYEGIDVSSWQRTIDFKAVKNAGIKVVYIKSSEGRSYIDPYFEQNYSNAKKNGLKVGFYHYVTARNTYQAKEQAVFFARVIAGKSPDCRLAMDFENFGNLSISQINIIAKTFLETLEKTTGVNVLIYSNAYSARNIFSSSLNSYPLWVANYNVSSPGENGKWKYWVGWQYTSTGTVNGVSGYVDKNKFTDGVLVSSKPIPTPENTTNPDSSNSENTITYTVKKGDTLSAIAKRYNTSVKDIVALNMNIKNPNLIYPGQRFIIITNTYNSSSTSSYYTYIVKKGDTLSQIALKYNTTVNKLVVLNNIKNSNLIYVNQKIKIYSVNNTDNGDNSCGKILYKIKYGDTLSQLALKYNSSISDIVKLNNISNPNLIYAGKIIRIPTCNTSFLLYN